ncbi:hypothetical protein ACLFKR_36130, partial [Paraburkholderia sp. BR14264]
EGASGPWPGPARVWFAVSSSSSSHSSKIRYPILTWALLQQNQEKRALRLARGIPAVEWDVDREPLAQVQLPPLRDARAT